MDAMPMETSAMSENATECVAVEIDDRVILLKRIRMLEDVLKLKDEFIEILRNVNEVTE